MKWLGLVLFMLVFAQGAFSQETYLESYVISSSDLKFGKESELKDGHVKGVCGHTANEEKPQGLTNAELDIVVGDSDFCYLQIMGKFCSRPVQNLMGGWMGLAGVTSEIQKDYFYRDLGSVNQIWYHVEVPGLLPGQKNHRFNPADYLGKDIVVFGTRPHGFDLVFSSGIFIIGNGGEVRDIYGNKIDGKYLFKLINERGELSVRSPLNVDSNVVLLGRPVGSMSDFRSTGVMEFQLINVLKGDAPDTVAINFLGEEWYRRHLPHLNFDSDYLMALKALGGTSYSCIDGKLGIFEEISDRYRGTSRYELKF